jgi:exopolysaccharide production protein ExoQ
MPRPFALLLCAVLIVALFLRDRKSHPGLSRALWIPLIWMFIVGSRSFSDWIHLGSATAGASTIEGYEEGSALDRNFLIVMFAIATAIVVRRKPQWSRVFRQNKVMIGFIVYCLISVVWSEFPMIAFRRLIRFLGVLPMCLIILTEESPREAITSIMRRGSYLFIPLSFLFVRYYSEFGRYYSPYTYEVSYSGVGGNKNALGMFCIVSALIFLWDLMQGWRRRSGFFRSPDTWSAALMLFLTVYLVRISASSTAIFCIIVGALVLAATSLPKLKENPRAVAYQVVGASAAAGIAQAIFDIKALIIRALGRSPSLTDRTTVWQTVLGMVNNPLLGTGYESFWTTARTAAVWQTGHGAIQAHNGYIDTYINLGIIGVAFFAALLVRCFLIVVRDMAFDFSFNQLRLSFLVVFGLYNYTEAAFPRTGLLLVLFFLFVFLVRPAGAPPVADGAA